MAQEKVVEFIMTKEATEQIYQYIAENDSFTEMTDKQWNEIHKRSADLLQDFLTEQFAPMVQQILEGNK